MARINGTALGDSLYGFDPAERPDISGKVGNAGVSICTLEDLTALYAGFDLCDPRTSVSMTKTRRLSAASMAASESAQVVFPSSPLGEVTRMTLPCSPGSAR